LLRGRGKKKKEGLPSPLLDNTSPSLCREAGFEPRPLENYEALFRGVNSDTIGSNFVTLIGVKNADRIFPH
jgi:hypothetical protein